MDDFAVFLRGAGFVFLLFVLFFVFLFPEETFLASFEEGDVPDVRMKIAREFEKRSEND